MIFVSTFITNAQSDTFATESMVRRDDSVCYNYSFFPGDTLFYYVESIDSIIFDFDDVLIKKRYERYRFTCDSVSKKKKIYMTSELINFNSIESKMMYSDVERTETLWLNRKVQFITDSTGFRHGFKLSDSTNPAMSPGGAFQPALLLNIGAECKAVNESWVIEETAGFPENGLPIPIIKQTYLYRARESMDTMDYSCNQFEYIRTGQGSVRVNTPDGAMDVSCVLNAFGRMLISDSLYVPIYYFSTIEQKLTIVFPDGTIKKGNQYTSSNYRLENLYRRKIKK